MMMKIKVTNCLDCPFKRLSAIDLCYNCALYSYPEGVKKIINADEVNKKIDPPKWCPLIEGEATISLKGRAKIERGNGLGEIKKHRD
jgi:hypothetical protein